MDPLKPTQKWSHCSIQTQATLFPVGEGMGAWPFYLNAGSVQAQYLLQQSMPAVGRSPTPSLCFLLASPGQTYIAVWRLSLLILLLSLLCFIGFTTKFFFKTYLFLVVLGLCCCAWACLVGASRQYSSSRCVQASHCRFLLLRWGLYSRGLVFVVHWSHAFKALH